eukprot:COSAG03_NODE_385_length_8317_cov_7.240813_8_plen_119_part_00
MIVIPPTCSPLTSTGGSSVCVRKFHFAQSYVAQGIRPCTIIRGTKHKGLMPCANTWHFRRCFALSLRLWLGLRLCLSRRLCRRLWLWLGLHFRPSWSSGSSATTLPLLAFSLRSSVPH